MKKNLFYLFALICSMSLFTSCSDDDDPVYPIEEEIAGTYKGTLDIELAGTPVATGMPKNITIAKVSGNSISLELKDFSFMGNNIGTINLEKCVLKQNGTSYTFTGSQELNLSGIGKCNVDVAGTINNGKAEVNLNIDVLQLGREVKVVYKGTKLTGSESSEAKITAFTIDSEFVTEQPVIDEATRTITFKVSDTATDDDLKSLKPVFTISEKATVTPASGVVQDFSNGKNVIYTVVSENGTVNEYIVSVAGRQSALKFSFEEWETIAGSFLTNEYVTPQPIDLLATSAPGAAFLKLFQITDLPVFKTDDKKEGEFAIKLVTMDTSAKVSTLVPAITSGSVFTGVFDLDVNDRIGSTKFGIAYDKKPIYFRGWYKYAPGAKYIDGSSATKPADIIEMPDKLDECAIQAVLYEAVGADGEDITLTGHDINTSDYRIAVAKLEDGTAKEEYTYFDIPFTFLTGKVYDETKTYKIAIVCSSSKEGDIFKGAGGSTLILDELEIIGEDVTVE